MTTKQSKSWVIGGAAIVAAIGIAAWLFGGPSTRDQLAADAMPSEPAAPSPAETPSISEPVVRAKPAPAETPTAKPAAAPAAPPEDAEDIFADSMPDFMVDIHARVLDKKWLAVSDQRRLYEYGKEHSDDARPQLLLAWDSLNRDWDGMAINLYGKAFRADARARADRKNLRDLLDVASKHDVERVEFTDATKIVQDSFGPAALPIVEEELARLNASGDLARAARMSRMRDALHGK